MNSKMMRNRLLQRLKVSHHKFCINDKVGGKGKLTVKKSGTHSLNQVIKVNH